jgi:hypothetical protein
VQVRGSYLSRIGIGAKPPATPPPAAPGKSVDDAPSA